jgi:hypothetical protein
MDIIPKILFLRDVYKRDLQTIDIIFENKILEELKNDYNLSNEFYKIEDEYKKNPSIFKSIDTWISSTNILCWYCNNKFFDKPKFIPKVIEPNLNGKLSISVEGNFCRWGCCIAYINEKYPKIIENTEKRMQLYYLYNLWNGTYPKIIEPAPNKYLQKPYGGDLSSEEYYKYYDQLLNE